MVMLGDVYQLGPLFDSSFYMSNLGLGFSSYV